MVMKNIVLLCIIIWMLSSSYSPSDALNKVKKSSHRHYKIGKSRLERLNREKPKIHKLKSLATEEKLWYYTSGQCKLLTNTRRSYPGKKYPSKDSCLARNSRRSNSRNRIFNKHTKVKKSSNSRKVSNKKGRQTTRGQRKHQKGKDSRGKFAGSITKLRNYQKNKNGKPDRKIIKTRRGTRRRGHQRQSKQGKKIVPPLSSNIMVSDQPENYKTHVKPRKGNKNRKEEKPRIRGAHPRTGKIRTVGKTNAKLVPKMNKTITNSQKDRKRSSKLGHRKRKTSKSHHNYTIIYDPDSTSGKCYHIKNGKRFANFLTDCYKFEFDNSKTKCFKVVRDNVKTEQKVPPIEVNTENCLPKDSQPKKPKTNVQLSESEMIENKGPIKAEKYEYNPNTKRCELVSSGGSSGKKLKMNTMAINSRKSVGRRRKSASRGSRYKAPIQRRRSHRQKRMVRRKGNRKNSKKVLKKNPSRNRLTGLKKKRKQKNNENFKGRTYNNKADCEAKIHMMLSDDPDVQTESDGDESIDPNEENTDEDDDGSGSGGEDDEDENGSGTDYDDSGEASGNGDEEEGSGTEGEGGGTEGEVGGTEGEGSGTDQEVDGTDGNVDNGDGNENGDSDENTETGSQSTSGTESESLPPHVCRWGNQCFDLNVVSEEALSRDMSTIFVRPDKILTSGSLWKIGQLKFKEAFSILDEARKDIENDDLKGGRFPELYGKLTGTTDKCEVITKQIPMIDLHVYHLKDCSSF